MPFKFSNLPKPPMPAFIANLENRAKGYSYVNIVVHVYQMYSFWFDVSGFGQTFLYALIYFGFILVPVGLGFFLLIGVHKREIPKVGIWWATEIGIFALNLTLFIIGVYKITIKTILNLFLHGALRIFGLKVIYDFMVTLNGDIGSSINKISIDRRDSNGTPPMDVVPLDDPWSGQEKL